MPTIKLTVELPDYTLTMSLTQTEFALLKTSFPPTITPLPHTRPTLRVSLRNCCHRRHITLYAEPPYHAKTAQSTQYAQTAPLSHPYRFTPLSLTSKPHTQRGTSRFKQCLRWFCGLVECGV